MEDHKGLFIFLFIVVAIGFGALRWYFEKKRREAFQALAAKLTLKYRRKDRSMAGRYAFLDKLAKGSNRYGYNILRGTFRDQKVQSFDYHYETYTRDSKGRRQTHHHRFSYFILEQDKAFPELRIYPENILSKLGQMMGFDDIDFESIEFSDAFTVRSKDRKFAYDVCHTGMMEYLLDHKDLSIEIEAQCIALAFDRPLRVEEIEKRLNQVCDIRELFPKYLYD